jgi:ribosomal protein S18 acetylase RimI-like enzyme
MDIIKVQRVSKADINELQKISRHTFFETFADANTEENMKNYLEESFALDRLSEEVANNHSQFFLAVINNQTIGYLKVNTSHAQTEGKDNDSLEIERIYVLKAFQGKKVGQLLYNKAVSIAEDTNLSSIWLGVWEENHRAIQFYEKNGFVEFDKHIFSLGDDNQTDLMMRKSLR